MYLSKVLSTILLLGIPASCQGFQVSLLWTRSTRSNPSCQQRAGLRAQETANDGESTFVQKQQQDNSPKSLEPDQLNFMLGYLNQHHSSTLKKFAQAMSPLGSEMALANARSGRSFVMQQASITHIDTQSATLSVLVQRRGKPDVLETVSFDLNADPIPERRRRYTAMALVADDPERLPIDDIVRRLNRLCWMVGDPQVTGKLIQLASQLGGAGVGKLPENMYLNQVPHNRYVRQFFYDQASEAVHEAVIRYARGDAQFPTNRMKLIGEFPEMNPQMDSYRIGTILEMVRAICIRMAEENLRVRLCVQGSMGEGIFTGVPKQLNGVSKLMQMMDWQSDVGEENQGMVGDYINFGAVGAEHVVNEVRNATNPDQILQHQDDLFVLIAPQSMVGTDSSITPLLEAMVEAAGDRPVILINPDLTDKVSAAGQQNVRGRQARLDFANSFQTVYHFQNLYVSGTSYFPILGAMTKLPSEPWVAHQRRDYADNKGEIYLPVLSCETKPQGEDILEHFER